jgi:MATE family multidrug resistance protein
LKPSVTYKEILQIAGPISFALILPQINFFTNTAFIGRLGNDELGVNGIAGITYLLLAMLGYGLNNGIQILLARRKGANEPQQLGVLLSNGWKLGLAFSLLLILTTLVFAPSVFMSSLHELKHAKLATEFIHIRIIGLPFLLLTQLANAFFIATSRSKVIVRGTLIATVVNVTFDYIFIYGKLGFQPMGINGAALASVLAEISSCVIMWGTFYKKGFQKSYSFHPLKKIEFSITINTLKVASPLIIQYLFSIGGWLLFFFYVEHLGTIDVAASQVLRSLLGIASIVTMAFAATCNTLVSQNIGKGNQIAVPSIIYKVALLSFICTSCIATFLLVFEPFFLKLYTNNIELVQHAGTAYPVVILGILIMAISTIIFNGVLGTGNTRTNLIIEIVSVAIYIIYCFVIIESLRMPLAYAWFSEVVYWFILLFLSFIYLKSGKWSNKII